MLSNICINAKHNRLSISVATLVALFVLGLLANPAAGQSYDSLPTADEYIVPTIPAGETPTREEKSKIASVERKIKSDRKKVAYMLQGREELDTAFVEAVFTDLEFPKMTQTDDETLSNISTLRAEFVKEFLSERVTGGPRTYFIEQVALPRIKAIANGNFHPSVRLNAVLLAGLINGVEPSRSTLPQISAPVVDYLLEVANSPQQPEYLKVGAMTGLHRNALFDGKQPQSRMPASEKGKIESFAASIVTQQATGQSEWSADANYWLRRRAIQTLGYLKNPAYGKDLIAVVNDADEAELIRLDAVLALKDMQLAAADADAAIMATTVFTAQQLQNEATGTIDQMAELVAINMLFGNENLLADGPGRNQRRPVRNGLGQSQAKVDLANYQLNQIRRRTKVIGFSCNQAFTALGQRATDEKRSTASSARRILEKLMTDIDEGLVDNAAVAEDDLGDGNLLGNPRDDEQPVAVADKLAEILRAAANNLNRLAGVDESGQAEGEGEMQKEGPAEVQPKAADDPNPFG